MIGRNTASVFDNAGTACPSVSLKRRLSSVFGILAVAAMLLMGGAGGALAEIPGGEWWNSSAPVSLEPGEHWTLSGERHEQVETTWILIQKGARMTIDGGMLSGAALSLVCEGELIVRNATVDEINSALGAQKFKTDLAEATTEAALRNERAISGAEQLEFFLRKAREDVMKAGPETPKHWRRPRLDVPERFISKDGQVHKVRNMLTELVDTPMPPEKARVIEARWKAVAKPEEAAKQLSDLYKAYESAWKRYTLFLFPEYHARNVIGDIWLGWMHGWKPSQIGKDMFDAAKIQAKSGAQRKVWTALYGEISGEDLIKAARDYGVIGTGQISEMETMFSFLGQIRLPDDIFAASGVKKFRRLNVLYMEEKLTNLLYSYRFRLFYVHQNFVKFPVK